MIGDSIFAVASPPGPAERGLLRLSGPQVFAAVRALVGRDIPRQRATLELPIPIDVSSIDAVSIDGMLLVMPGPNSFTGEDVVEIHLPGSPLLLERVARALGPTLRLATPGEFTRRAFLNGRLDLAAAEGVAGLIHAESVEEHRYALSALRGGLAASVDACRAHVFDALALIEAGLDFAEGETGEVDVDTWRPQLDAARCQIRVLRDGIPVSRPGGGDLLLVGPANAGKSSLCNALASAAAAEQSTAEAAGAAGAAVPVLVDARAGTTRDIVAVTLAGSVVRLLDTPGDLDGEPDASATDGWDRAALELRDRLGALAAGKIVVVPAGASPATLERASARHPELPTVATVRTKLDLLDSGHPPLAPGEFGVSSVSGAGLDELREYLFRGPARPAGCATGEASGGRVAGRLTEALQAVEAALAATLAGDGGELTAMELQVALDRLDDVNGRSSPEQVLDRVFSDFCLGK